MLLRLLAAVSMLLGTTVHAQISVPGKMRIDAVGNVSSDGKINKRLSPTAELAEFLVADDFKVELVVAEPTIINPVALAVDEQGRMIVSESHTYRYGPKGSPVKPYKNPVVRLEPRTDKSGFERVLVAEGFDDPVMGIAVKGDKLWLTANNHLYRFDYPVAGPATNKQTLVIDKHKVWNPFGMFVLEWGPDGLLYLSVGDHRVELIGPKAADGKPNTITSRGSSGVIVRMHPDGSNMERLTQGFRVPYSFEYDPFGQLWLLSNGEGNPNRFARIVPGVDYHCYTRKVDNNWLAGNHPLAPPTFELLRGAHTQLLRYYAAAYPAEYQGNLFLDNWGAHGFHGPNRGIFRYVPDKRGHIVAKNVFVSNNDPHFRPATITLDPEGNMLIADWYGRDDESDLTGRIWRVRYTGSAPVGDKASESENFNLGAPGHLVRQKAIDKAVAASDVKTLSQFAATATNALGAANALWCLRRIGTESAHEALLSGLKNGDARVRRLAIDLSRQVGVVEKLRAALPNMLKDDDAAVRLEAAITWASPEAMLGVLNGEVAKDKYLRYRAATSLATIARAADFERLLNSDDADVRLAGLIALDVALYEKTPAREHALATLDGLLAGLLAGLPRADMDLVLTLVHQHADKSILPTLEKFVSRDSIAPAALARAFVIYRGLAGKLPAVAGTNFLKGVHKGVIRLGDQADHQTLLDLLEAEGPTDLAIPLLDKQIRGGHPATRSSALALARRFGPKSGAVADTLWPIVFQPKAKNPDPLEALATVAVIQTPPQAALWTKLLDATDPVLRTDAVRWFRAFKKNPGLSKALAERAPLLVKADPDLADDLATVFRELGVDSTAVPSDDGKRDKLELAKRTAADFASWSPAVKQNHVLLGRQVFERAQCTRCHTTVTQNTPLAPSLKGIAAQKLEYLVESILEPSKIIKTGFDAEIVVTTSGKTLTGLVKDEGTHLRVLNFGVDVRVPKNDVEERSVQKRSIMPEGQELLLSRREFVDLIAYLSSLK